MLSGRFADGGETYDPLHPPTRRPPRLPALGTGGAETMTHYFFLEYQYEEMALLQ